MNDLKDHKSSFYLEICTNSEKWSINSALQIQSNTLIPHRI